MFSSKNLRAWILLSILLGLIGFIAFAVRSVASPTALAKKAFEDQVTSQSKGDIQVTSFQKTDRLDSTVNGVKTCRLEYVAEISFSRSGQWVSGSWPGRLEYEFTTDRQPNTATGDLLSFVEGGKPVNAGDRIRIEGTMIGIRKESGWKFEPGDAKIASKLQPTVAARSSQNNPERARRTCINNLRIIDAAKNEWYLEQPSSNGKPETYTPPASELLKYLATGDKAELPVCPSGGTYSLNAVKYPPTCTIPGHALPVH